MCVRSIYEVCTSRVRGSPYIIYTPTYVMMMMMMIICIVLRAYRDIYDASVVCHHMCLFAVIANAVSSLLVKCNLPSRSHLGVQETHKFLLSTSYLVYILVYTSYQLLLRSYSAT